MRLAAAYAAIAGDGDDLQALRQEACRVAATGLESDFAKLLVYQPDTRDFLVQAGVGWRAGVVGRSRLDADIGTAAGFAWHAGEAVIFNGSVSDRRFRMPDLLKEHGLSSCINIPVPGVDRSPCGLLEVESARHGQFGTDDVCFLRLLAYSLAAAQNRLARQSLHDEQAARVSSDYRLSLHEMQHRVRNDLQGICSSIDREIQALADQAQKDGYNRVGRRVLALAGLYDHLLNIPEAETIDLGAYLRSLCLRIEAATDLSSRGIVLGAETQPIRVDIARAGRLAIAVNELVANAAEHAFPDGRHGEIMVRLFPRIADGSACPVLTVSDNGTGFRGPRPGSSGLGFVERLVRGAGGVLTRLDGPGTEWQIAMPC